MYQLNKNKSRLNQLMLPEQVFDTGRYTSCSVNYVTDKVQSVKTTQMLCMTHCLNMVIIPMK
jgi:hypothetical protein